MPAPEATPAGAPSDAADLELLSEAAKNAGQIALRHFRNDPKTWEKDDGQGPVTEADLAVDADLARTLRAARPGYGWMSEETPDDPVDRNAARMFIVDPIDGTRAFLKGEVHWALSLAVVDRGTPVAALVYLPAMDRLYSASRGAGAARDGRAIGAAAAPPGGLDTADMLVTRPNLAPDLWRNASVPGLTRHFRPSLAYRLALVAEGRFDGMLTLRDSWEWDIAAGTLIAQEAGATVTDRAGAALSFNSAWRKTSGVIAASAPLHAEITARLAPGARHA